MTKKSVDCSNHSFGTSGVIGGSKLGYPLLEEGPCGETNHSTESSLVVHSSSISFPKFIFL